MPLLLAVDFLVTGPKKRQGFLQLVDLGKSGLDIEFKALFGGIPAMETRSDAEIVKITERLTGHTAGAVAYATEAPYLAALGLDTIILGPGDIEQAHQPDEFIGMDRLQPMTDILMQLITEVGRL